MDNSRSIGIDDFGCCVETCPFDVLFCNGCGAVCQSEKIEEFWLGRKRRKIKTTNEDLWEEGEDGIQD